MQSNVFPTALHFFSSLQGNHMKKFTFVSSFLLLVLLISGCNGGLADKSNTPEVSSITLINPLGPLVIPASGITSGNIVGNVQINVQNWKTIDEVTGLLSGEDVSFAVLPVTTAVNLNANGIDLVMLGVYEWKVFYLVASQNTQFTDWNSMIGKTVYSPEAKGQTVDTLTRYALEKAGITPDQEVNFVYAPAQEIVQLFNEGKIDFAALPEPYVSLALQGDNGKIVLDYQDYWSKESGATDGIPIAGLFVKRDFYLNHSDLVEQVAQTLSESIDWANKHPEEAITASSQLISIPEKVMQASLQRMKFEYVPASKCKQEVLDYLQAIQSTYPQGIKSIPPDDFFAE
jgi:NitT/TauT family transport system substrate-binding protein